MITTYYSITKKQRCIKRFMKGREPSDLSAASSDYSCVSVAWSDADSSKNNKPAVLRWDDDKTTDGIESEV